MESVSVGRMLSQTIKAFTGNFGAFFLIGAVVAIITNGVVLALGMEDLLIYGTVPPESISGQDLLVILAVMPILYAGLYMAASGAITFGTIRYLNNDPATIAECLSRGVAVAIPLFAMGVLAALGISIGMMLLIVPGVILLLMWYVAAPVLVVERAGIIGALGRSAELTKGARWKLLAVAGIIYGAAWTIGATTGALTFFLPTMVYVLISSLLEAVFLVLGAVAASVVYQELRIAKEGIGVSDMAQVFD